MDEKELETERQNELEDIKKILETEEGKRYFKRFFKMGYLFTTTFTGNSQGFFLEGHRNLALKVFNEICEASPQSIPKLIIEEGIE